MRGRTRQSAPPIFEAALPTLDARGIDPVAALRHRRQSAVGASRGEKTRNRFAPELRRGPVSHRSATAYRKRFVSFAGWGPGSVDRDLGNSFPYATAGERSKQLHSARGFELARAGGGCCFFPSAGHSVRLSSGASFDPSDRPPGRPPPPL